MAEKKKTSGGNDGKNVEKIRSEAAEALRKASELIQSLNEPDGSTPAQKTSTAKKTTASKSTPKKPAEKSSAPKKPAAKKSVAAKTENGDNKQSDAAVDKPAAKKPAQKKPAAKKPAAKKAPEKNTDVEQARTVEGPIAEQPEIKQEEVAREVAATAPAEEQPAPEQLDETPAVEEKEIPAIAEDNVATEPVEQQPTAQPEPEPEPDATVQQQTMPENAPAEKADAKQSFKQKANGFIDGKGKLILFVIINALLAFSAIMLVVSAFDITSYITGESEWFSLFGYYGNSAEIKDLLTPFSMSYASGAYTVIGILMALATVVPIALLAKNVLLFILKRNKEIHLADGAITAASMTAYLGVVNMFGANMTFGHIIALVVALALLVFTVLVMFLQGKFRSFPIYSMINLALITVCAFVFGATPVYSPDIYAAGAASLSDSAGIAFVLSVATVVTLAVFLVMQVKKLPKLFDLIVPELIFVLALVSLVLYAIGTPDGVSLGGGFAVGAILTALTAAVYSMFGLIPMLKKFKLQPATDEPKADAAAENTSGANESAQAPVNDGADVPAQVFCSECGTSNAADDLFCSKCGKRLEK